MSAEPIKMPAWADILRERYLAGEANVFVLHGNVFDSYPLGKDYAALPRVLDSMLAKKDSLLELSLAQGVRIVRSQRALPSLDGLQEKGLGGALQYLESHMRTHHNTAVVVPYAETLFPAAETHHLSFEERAAVTTLHRWSLDEALGRSDAIIILVAETLTSLAPSLLSNPRIIAIDLGLPDEAARTEAIAQFAPALSAEQRTRIAEQTAGLRLVQISSIVSDHGRADGLDEAARRSYIAGLLGESPDAASRAQEFARVTAGMSRQAIRALIAPATPEEHEEGEDEVMAVIRRRKREILEKECSGLIEFIEPRHGLEVVGGNAAIKTELARVAKALREGDIRRAPMGLLAVGPMGSGKTFVIKAFLKEAGLNGVMLKNFRSQWVGATESNLERVLAMVKVMGPVALVIDEGDRSFGSRSEDSDGGTSSRVIARLKTFMSEPENRGRVLFIMMTNRPDKLDIDIKRPGRLDVKLPFFYAQTDAERVEIVGALLARHGMSWVATDAQRLQACTPLAGYSNADLEAVVLLAAASVSDQGSSISAEQFEQAVADFMPPQDRNMVRYMELLAALECSRRSWLPAHLQDLSTEAMQAQLLQLQHIIH
ncbi:ATPase AAA [Chitinimonas prasina]|uniref:ATPase AAA n=1 Tax=Chitinimonas prasina TaxID=1434937 RepID=A0ABQ5YBW9_9NEIS|nr:AAA family ATPase [Chitinimonas prasina]GLR11404.1 ATPase AAA [Chitinimonas prasina]